VISRRARVASKGSAPEIRLAIGAFCRQVMELNFVLDQDINQPDRLAQILTGLGLPAASILEQAQAEPAKALLREQTEQARVRGIFGAPTFFVGTEMFWGNDRLDDALTLAQARGAQERVDTR
jgi:2-hydroxychromene-2-carboxylate isomerase